MKSALGSSSGIGIESLAFFPQMFLSVVAIPLLLSKKDLASTMLAQTFAFVTFNKVCTSQVCASQSQVSIAPSLMGMIVLLVVHGLPAILPSQLVAPSPTQAGLYRACPLGDWPGKIFPYAPPASMMLTISGSVAAPRIRARIPRPLDLRPRTVASQYGFLRHKLLDPGYRGV